MVPAPFQLPPPSTGASATTTAGPPDTAMVLSLLSAKYPSELLSADQNGSDAPSVPGSGRAGGEPRERTQSMVFPVASVAQKAKACPSLETAGAPRLDSENRVFSGGSISEVIARSGARARRQCDTELTIAPRRNTTASAQGSARCKGLGGCVGPGCRGGSR